MGAGVKSTEFILPKRCRGASCACRTISSLNCICNNKVLKEIIKEENTTIGQSIYVII